MDADGGGQPTAGRTAAVSASGIFLPCWRVDFADGWTTASHAETAEEAVADAGVVWQQYHTGPVPSGRATRLPDDQL